MKIVSLKLKIVLSTVLTCTLIVLAISFIDLFRYREAEKTRIHEEFVNFEKGAKVTIREAVWLYDWNMVRTILESQTSQVISFVEICDNKISKCLQHGTRNKSPYLEFQTSILYEGGDSDDEIEIGKIYLQSHYDTIPTYIYNDLPRFLFTNILSVFGIALILFSLFHRQVIQRLLILEQYTRKIDLKKIDSLDPPVCNDRVKFRDEIDLLADAVSNLIEKTKNELVRRKNLEQQLNQAQKMEALGNLAGGIAHDFNNILAAILGFAELSCLKCEPHSELHGNLKKIIGAGQRARNLISQILVFSRRTDSPQEILTLATVVDEALHLMRVSLPANIRIETVLDPDIRIKGDSTRLHQVIMNLTTNGAQAIGDRSGTLKIALRDDSINGQQAGISVLQPGRYCCLEISDDGPGIPDEILPRIFEPFFTTKQSGKGTGMGLAVVHGIVHNHGGAIIVDSTVGVGTTFSIYLPQTEEGIIEIDKLSDTPTGSGQTIVLVDDEIQVLDMGKSILEGLGYKVMSFNKPKEAIAFLQEENSIDLVITDLTMPEMSGVELANSLKVLYPSLPIMLWTGYKDDIASESLKENLIHRILQKPFHLEDLAQAVSQVLVNTNPTQQQR
ncbi:ATP-binding protein [Desulfopila aestuarii]|uniref:histidine kinase n=1 Tax=Desulfopila aestuarii DSM 18488 TaxID=1121416 RepID=A0A1M7XVN3_9BACT|nr:ATP-binding protein [Desulfopila aestuarii]SHO42701.1 His Kinase A (phospho-acceptor) domain-containing protein [Desulfopila aestuarii DSM 18488]